MTTGSGGATTGSGGVTSSGGTTPGTGGATTGSGGSTTGSGGSTTGTGGTTTGSGGATTGSGGSTTGSGGETTGSGGTSTGSGGATGGHTGGGSTGKGGMTASGGTTGSGGSSGGGGSVSALDEVAGKPNMYMSTLKNAFILMPCYSLQNQDCNTIPAGTQCQNMSAANYEDKGYKQTEVFTLGGTSGTMYNMTFTARGIVEAKYYMGGTRDAGNATPTDPDNAAGIDTFYRGGSPINQEFYNVYKMVVKKPDGSELAHYYLNSFDKNSGFENHRTFPIHYTKTIPVVGGGSIELFAGDSNCRAVNNCGAGATSSTCPATAGRKVPEGAGETPVSIPTMYMGKTVASINLQTGTMQPYKSQIVNILVTAVTAM
jgi:hypothetical protein